MARRTGRLVGRRGAARAKRVPVVDQRPRLGPKPGRSREGRWVSRGVGPWSSSTVEAGALAGGSASLVSTVLPLPVTTYEHDVADMTRWARHSPGSRHSIHQRRESLLQRTPNTALATRCWCAPTASTPEFGTQGSARRRGGVSTESVRAGVIAIGLDCSPPPYVPPPFDAPPRPVIPRALSFPVTREILEGLRDRTQVERAGAGNLLIERAS